MSEKTTYLVSMNGHLLGLLETGGVSASEHHQGGVRLRLGDPSGRGLEVHLDPVGMEVEARPGTDQAVRGLLQRWLLQSPEERPHPADMLDALQAALGWAGGERAPEMSTERVLVRTFDATPADLRLTAGRMLAHADEGELAGIALVLRGRMAHVDESLLAEAATVGLAAKGRVGPGLKDVGIAEAVEAAARWYAAMAAPDGPHVPRGVVVGSCEGCPADGVAVYCGGCPNRMEDEVTRMLAREYVTIRRGVIALLRTRCTGEVDMGLLAEAVNEAMAARGRELAPHRAMEVGAQWYTDRAGNDLVKELVEYRSPPETDDMMDRHGPECAKCGSTLIAGQCYVCNPMDRPRDEGGGA